MCNLVKRHLILLDTDAHLLWLDCRVQYLRWMQQQWWQLEWFWLQLYLRICLCVLCWMLHSSKSVRAFVVQWNTLSSSFSTLIVIAQTLIAWERSSQQTYQTILQNHYADHYAMRDACLWFCYNVEMRKMCIMTGQRWLLLLILCNFLCTAYIFRMCWWCLWSNLSDTWTNGSTSETTVFTGRQFPVTKYFSWSCWKQWSWSYC